MFDILIYLYDHYLGGSLPPDTDALSTKLSAVGFDADEIDRALSWLSALDQLAPTEPLPETQSQRGFSPLELQRIETEGLSFILLLEQSGLLPAHGREWVIDRALALGDESVTTEKIKWIALLAIARLNGPGDALWLEDLVRSDDDFPPTLH